MLTHGVSIRDINSLSLKQARQLWVSYQSGVWGNLPQISIQCGTVGKGLADVFPTLCDFAEIKHKGNVSNDDVIRSIRKEMGRD